MDEGALPHGNAPFQEGERILRLHGVATLVDVRSTPFSRYGPDFRKSALAVSAAAAIEAADEIHRST